MKLADVAKRVVVNPRKLTHYALDPNSPHGKHKAVLFEKLLSLTKGDYLHLIEQLEAKSLQTEITFHSEDVYGKRYTADVMVEGQEGQHAIVRTGWLVPPDTDEAQLITLYVRKR